MKSKDLGEKERREKRERRERGERERERERDSGVEEKWIKTEF
jgi:hypothetical protein